MNYCINWEIDHQNNEEIAVYQSWYLVPLTGYIKLSGLKLIALYIAGTLEPGTEIQYELVKPKCHSCIVFLGTFPWFSHRP